MEFRELQQSTEKGEWMTSTLIWVEFPVTKDNEGRKSERNGGGVPGQ